MIHAVVPVLNEEPNIAGLVDRLKEALQPFTPYRVLFVDDGSTDLTVEALKGKGPEIETVSRHGKLQSILDADRHPGRMGLAAGWGGRRRMNSRLLYETC